MRIEPVDKENAGKHMNHEENNLLVSVKEIKKIDKTTAKVEIINSIKDKYKSLRQKSKGP